MLLVAVTCTFADVGNNFSRLKASISNFSYCFSSEVFFLIVYQSKSSDKKLLDSAYHLISNVFGEVLPVDYLSASRARNDALDFAREKKFDSIIFHDASLIFTPEYLQFLKSRLGNHLLSGEVAFSSGHLVKNSESVESRVYFNNFEDLYVWSYVFPLSANIPYFDVRFGPGEDTCFFSGEDFLFLRKFFKLNPEMNPFLRFTGPGILHPPRPGGYTKHLSYARGQGKIHQVFLLEEKSLYALWRCILFFGNALFRALLFKKNSLKILLLRLKGFFDTKVKV